MDGYWAIPKDVSARKDISNTAKAVYQVLWTRRNGDNIAWPSQEYIAEQIGSSIQSTKRGVKVLVVAGLLVSKRRGLGRSNVYSFPEVLPVILPEVSKMIHLYNVSEDSNIRLPASPHKARVTTNEKQMHRTDERKFSDEYEPVVDAETGLPVKAKQRTKAVASMVDLLTWAAKRNGGAFTNPPKQFAAMKRMKNAGIDPQEIKNRWVEMESDRFYSEKGFDFATVAGSFDRKRK